MCLYGLFIEQKAYDCSRAWGNTFIVLLLSLPEPGAGLDISLLAVISQWFSAWPCTGHLGKPFSNSLLWRVHLFLRWTLDFYWVIFCVCCTTSMSRIQIAHSKFSSQIYVLVAFKLSFLDLTEYPIEEYKTTLVLV